MRLIDADAKTFPTPYKYNDTKYAKGWNACLNSVAQHPTIDAVLVIHSEWEITEVDHAYGKKCYHCPECGTDEWRYDGARYCPNCGAKMDGGAK